MEPPAGAAPARLSYKGNEPLAGLFHQLTPSAFKNRSSGKKALGRSIYFASRGSKWCARPVTLRIQTPIRQNSLREF
jgi:hypothetical protein